MFAYIEIRNIEDDVEKGKRCAGVIYDLVCEPNVFRAGHFHFFIVGFCLPLK
jgi:hypothetical protein